MTDCSPTWLPDTVSVRGCLPDVCARLHDIFNTDFIVGKPRFQTLPVWWDRAPGDSGYHRGFWHLVTSYEPAEARRVLDPPRARKLPWCAPTLINGGDAVVLVWDYEEADGAIRTYVWLREPLHYCIVLQRKAMRTGTVAFLVTAYSTEGSSHTLRRKYDKRVP